MGQMGIGLGKVLGKCQLQAIEKIEEEGLAAGKVSGFFHMRFYCILGIYTIIDTQQSPLNKGISIG